MKQDKSTAPTPKQQVKHPLRLLALWVVGARELAAGHYLMNEPSEAEAHERQALAFEILIHDRQYERPQIATVRR